MLYVIVHWLKEMKQVAWRGQVNEASNMLNTIDVMNMEKSSGCFVQKQVCFNRIWFLTKSIKPVQYVLKVKIDSLNYWKKTSVKYKGKVHR